MQHRHCVVFIQHIYSVCIAHIRVVQIGECQILEENHENGSETGPYGSVQADIHTRWIPQALGSLWDASRASKRPWKIKKSRFSGFFNIFEYFQLFFLSSLNSNRPEPEPCWGEEVTGPPRRLGGFLGHRTGTTGQWDRRLLPSLLHFHFL